VTVTVSEVVRSEVRMLQKIAVFDVAVLAIVIERVQVLLFVSAHVAEAPDEKPHAMTARLPAGIVAVGTKA
jgi:hypothetical protein